MRRNYDASNWVAHNNQPDRFCDHCMDVLDDDKCANENCPKYNHFIGCDHPGDECSCHRIQKQREDEAGDEAAEAVVDEVQNGE